MSGEVRSTPTGLQALKELKVLINGELEGLLNQLNQKGEILSQPTNWEGKLAGDFRGMWPGMHKASLKLKQDLDQLQSWAQKINDDIQAAGGNR